MTHGAEHVLTIGDGPVAAPRVKTRRQPHAGRQLSKRILSALLPRRMFMVGVPRGSKSVCLTFDDGPHPEHTPRLLDVLRELGVPATFFLVGKNAELHPDVVRRIVGDGHAIGHHTYHHSRLDRISVREMVDEIQRTDRVFERVIGRRVRLFRPPWGRITAAKILRLVASRHSIVLWTSDPKDCERRSAADLAAWFVANPPQAGDVVLMHDDHSNASAVLPELVADVRSRGLSFATPLAWTGRA